MQLHSYSADEAKAAAKELTNRLRNPKIEPTNLGGKLGLRWRKFGWDPPLVGTELFNEALAGALVHRIEDKDGGVEISEAELEAFALTRELRSDSFIRAGRKGWENYWRVDLGPVPQWVALARKLPTGREQVKERDKLFAAADGGNKGYLSLAEIEAMLQRYKVEVNRLTGDERGLKDSKPAILRAYQAAKDVSGRLGTRPDPEAQAAGIDASELVSRDEFRFLLVALQRYFELLAMFLTIDTTDDQRIGLDEFRRAAPAFRDWGLGEAGTRGGYIVRNAKAEFAKIDTNHQGHVLFDEFAKWALDVNLRLLPDAPETCEDLRQMRATAGSVEAARVAAKKASARIKKVRSAERAEAAAQAKANEEHWARMKAIVEEREKQPHVSLEERNAQLLQRRRHVKTKTDSDVMDEVAGKYMQRLHELGKQERRTLNERLAEQNCKQRAQLSQVRSSLQASGMTRNAAYDEKVMERMHASGASAASSSTDDIAFLDEHKDTATLINEIRSRFTSVRDGQSLDGWTRRHDPFRERLRAREGLDALDRKFAKMAPPKPPTPPTAVDAPDAAIAADAVRGASSTAAPSGNSY